MPQRARVLSSVVALGSSCAALLLSDRKRSNLGIVRPDLATGEGTQGRCCSWLACSGLRPWLDKIAARNCRRYKMPAAATLRLVVVEAVLHVGLQETFRFK